MNILSTLQQYAKIIRQIHIYAKNVAYILDIRLFGIRPISFFSFFFWGGEGGGGAGGYFV